MTAMTKEAILEKLRSVLAESFQLDPARIHPETHLFTDLDLDSIDAVELAIQVQNITGRRVKADGSTTKLASWFAGAPQAAPLSPAVLVPPGASIVAKIEYRRTWKYEAQVLNDASSVGLYFGKTAVGGR